jgi:hypothetical protein
MFNILNLFTQIPSIRVVVGFTFVSSLCIGCVSTFGMPAQDPSVTSAVGMQVQTGADSYVKSGIRGITNAPSRKVKIERAQELCRWIGRHQDEVSAMDIDALTKLLTDEDDSIRIWTAGALGLLGKKAKSAVPQLERALLERPCANTPATSASAIRLALSRIGAQPINASCTISPAGR